jgi:hypothetical protein
MNGDHFVSFIPPLPLTCSGFVFFQWSCILCLVLDKGRRLGWLVIMQQNYTMRATGHMLTSHLQGEELRVASTTDGSKARRSTFVYAPACAIL